MPLTETRSKAAAAIADACEIAFGHRPESVELEVPPRRELGDLAWPGALPLARVLKRAPRQIADSIVAAASWPEGVVRAEIAGPGFINLFLDRAAVLSRLLAGDEGVAGAAGKVIVEHTNINPNKAAHIGHLRNAVLGDVLVRCLRHLGHEVEVQNYVDDTGVQVADVVVGALFLPEAELAAALGVEIARRDELLAALVARLPVEDVPTASTADFDDLCWELYPRVTARYEAEPEFSGHRAEVLHALEEGFEGLTLEEAMMLLRGAVIAAGPFPGRAVACLAAAVADGNLRCHLATMARLAIGYDVLPHESDILQLGFWRRAFDLLREGGAIRKESDGKNAGCWVMSLAGSPEFADMDDPDKVLVRSNGTVTYTGKDIAYQLWKLGLLTDPDGKRHDFGYRPFARWAQAGPAAPVRYGEGDRMLARSTAVVGERVGEGLFGGGSRVYNVIDVRQSYPQKVVREAVRVLGHEAAAASSIHFAYEMVALTPAAVRRLEEHTGRSFGLSEEDLAKSYVEMSGRRGIGVKADEFLDTLVEAAADAVTARAAEGLTVDSIDARARAHRGRGTALPDGAPVAQPGARLRLRRGAGVRGRHRAVPAVLGGARREDLRQAAHPSR